MKLVLLGPPGAGKGTLAKELSDKFSIPSISTGEMLRAAVKKGGNFGSEAANLMQEGKLLPDDLILNIVKERLSQPDCKKGYILDGVPRTVMQAKGLELSGVEVNNAVLLEVADEIVIKRMTARRVCENCGAGYNIETMPSKQNGICDVCGGKLIMRADDSLQTITERLEVYHNETAPVVEFYKSRGKLLTVPSGSTPQKTLDALLLLLPVQTKQV